MLKSASAASPSCPTSSLAPMSLEELLKQWAIYWAKEKGSALDWIALNAQALSEKRKSDSFYRQVNLPWLEIEPLKNEDIVLVDPSVVTKQSTTIKNLIAASPDIINNTCAIHLHGGIIISCKNKVTYVDKAHPNRQEKHYRWFVPVLEIFRDIEKYAKDTSLPYHIQQLFQRAVSNVAILNQKVQFILQASVVSKTHIAPKINLQESQLQSSSVSNQASSDAKASSAASSRTDIVAFLSSLADKPNTKAKTINHNLTADELNKMVPTVAKAAVDAGMFSHPGGSRTFLVAAAYAAAERANAETINNFAPALALPESKEEEEMIQFPEEPASKGEQFAPGKKVVFNERELLIPNLFPSQQATASAENATAIIINNISLTYANEAALRLWHFPANNDNSFVERKNEVQKLKDWFSQYKKSDLILATLCSLGGVGKTQIAIQFNYHTQIDYDWRLWLHAESRAVLLADYRVLVCAMKLLPETGHSASDTVIIETIKAFFNSFSNKSLLFVFDNAGPYEDIKDCIPVRGHVLITTRRKEWLDITPNVINLKVFIGSEAIGYLKKSTGIAEPQEVTIMGNLADKLGCLPLALAQASAYINKCHIKVSDYLKLYQEMAADLLALDILPAYSSEPLTLEEKEEKKMVKTVATTWLLSIQNIEKEEKSNNEPPLAKKILYMMSCLYSQNIKRNLIECWLIKLNIAQNNVIATFLLNKIIYYLDSYSLIEPQQNKESMNIHNLVQFVIRNNKFLTLEQPKENLLYKMMELIYQRLKNNDSSTEFYTNKLPDILHAKALVENCHDLLKNQALYLQFVLELGILLFNIGNTLECIKILSNVIKHREASDNKETIEDAEIKRLLGRAYGSQEMHKQQRSLISEALSMFTRFCGEESKEVAETICYLSAAYGGDNENKKQLELLKNAYSIAKKVYPENHIEIIKIMHRIADAHAQLGDPLKQQEILLEVLPRYEAEFGKESIKVAEVKNSLGYALGSLNNCHPTESDLNEKLNLVKSALAIYTNFYGENNLRVAEVKINLADTYGDLKQYDNMLKMCEQAISYVENSFGKNDPKYARMQIYLAKYYGYISKNDIKSTILNSVLDLLEEINGPDRTFTLALHHLEETMPAEKDTEKKLLQRLHQFRLHKFGSNHELTIRVANKLSSLEENNIKNNQSYVRPR